jgi:tRNA dimethylallyltransferase
LPQIKAPRLVTIVGPTAVGKSRLAIRLAQQFGGEIVSADSRQMYRYMDIGTAKPGREERALIPYHLIDIVNPDEDFSLAQYQQLAYRTIANIHQRGKLPWLVGGSGLYVWAVVEEWSIPPIPPDPALRRTLAERAAKGEVAELYQELMALDPVAAQKIDPRNVRRVIRAIEVTRSAGVPFSQLQQKKAPPFQTLMIGLTADRVELYRRIDARVDEMLAHGLVEEVKKLAQMGYSLNLPAMSGIGYRQIGLYLRGDLSLAEAIQQIKYETHRFARHQYSWFRLNDKRIQWFDAGGEVESAIGAKVAEFLSTA